MSRAKQRADRIRADVEITQVLSDYGYDVNAEGGDREQQFSCDLHGDGSDSKPSARAYPDSNSWYCFACGRTRDAIQTVREKEGLDFWPAIKVIEARYKLPALPWEDEEEVRAETLGEKIIANLRSDRTFEEERVTTERLLQTMTDEKEAPIGDVLAHWEAYDRVCHGVAKEEWSEEKGKTHLLALRKRIIPS